MSSKCFRVDLGRKLREDRQLTSMFLRKPLLSREKNKGDGAERSLVGLNSNIVRALKTTVHVHGRRGRQTS